jgi:hypothetical protein
LNEGAKYPAFQKQKMRQRSPKYIGTILCNCLGSRAGDRSRAPKRDVGLFILIAAHKLFSRKDIEAELVGLKGTEATDDKRY